MIEFIARTPTCLPIQKSVPTRILHERPHLFIYIYDIGFPISPQNPQHILLGYHNTPLHNFVSFILFPFIPPHSFLTKPDDSFIFVATSQVLHPSSVCDVLHQISFTNSPTKMEYISRFSPLDHLFNSIRRSH